MLLRITLLAATVALGACATQTFRVNGDTSLAASEQITHHFFISGVGQQQTVAAAELCGGADRVIQVETETTFLNGFLGVITWGIYTPRDARVYCRF